MLNFTGMPGLRYADGKHTFFEGRYVTFGTNPPGSMWAQNPIPRIHFDSTSSGQPASYANEFNCTHPAHGVGCRQFDPYACEEMAYNPLYDAPWGPVRGSPPGRLNTDIEGICSGDWVSGEITDNVIIPPDLPTGDYVVGFRWDCEYVCMLCRYLLPLLLCQQLLHSSPCAGSPCCRALTRTAPCGVVDARPP